MALEITGITENPNQSFTVALPDGTKLLVTMQYFDQNNGWFFTSLNWNNGQWIEEGRRVVSHLNMLRGYRNIINFGLSCITVGNREPTQIQDFASGASVLSILLPSEVQEVETFLQSLKYA